MKDGSKNETQTEARSWTVRTDRPDGTWWLEAQTTQEWSGREIPHTRWTNNREAAKKFPTAQEAEAAAERCGYQTAVVPTKQ